MEKTNKPTTPTKFFSRLFENNWFVLVFSLLIAVMLWCGVSMFQTKEIEKQFVNIKVQLNYDGSLPDNKNLKIFGEHENYIDVTVKGKSYLVNDDNFAEHISATVSFAAVSSPGTYALPVNVSLNDTDAEIVNYSKSTISVYVDELVEKEFTVSDEIIEGDGYSLPEGYTRENPRLSDDTVVLEGAALEISRITAVKAVVELDKELTSTETFTAELVFVGASEAVTFNNVSIKTKDPIHVTIPISHTAEYTPIISFTGTPKALRTKGVDYTISPDKVEITIATGENKEIQGDEITVGSIDFSEINNDKNIYRVYPDDLPYEINGNLKYFTVTVDMSSMHKRWLEIDVTTDGGKLPDGAKLLTESIQSVQIVGPAESVDKIANSEAYAVPQLENVKLEKGVNIVPAKIILRTLTDSWVRGEYSVEIQVD